MINFNDMINQVSASNSAEYSEELDTLTNKTIAEMTKAQINYPTAIFFLGYDSPNFTYGNAVNVTSQGGRASFRLRMIVPEGFDRGEGRSVGGSVYIDNLPTAQLPYVRQNQPSPGFVQYPYTEDGGWQYENFGGEGQGFYVKEQMYTFSFGPECIPLKVTSFPLVFRKFGFYTGGNAPGGGGGMEARTLVAQKNNPAGIIEVDPIETMNIRLQPTCEGAPSFQVAPPPKGTGR